MKDKSKLRLRGTNETHSPIDQTASDNANVNVTLNFRLLSSQWHAILGGIPLSPTYSECESLIARISPVLSNVNKAIIATTAKIAIEATLQGVGDSEELESLKKTKGELIALEMDITTVLDELQLKIGGSIKKEAPKKYTGMLSEEYYSVIQIYNDILNEWASTLSEISRAQVSEDFESIKRIMEFLNKRIVALQKRQAGIARLLENRYRQISASDLDEFKEEAKEMAKVIEDLKRMFRGLEGMKNEIIVKDARLNREITERLA